MKRNFWRFALFLTLLLIYSIVMFPYDSFSPKIKETFKTGAQRAGVFWDSSDFRFDMPPQIAARQISGVIKTANLPIPFSIDTLEVSSSVWSMITLAPALNFAATLYGGRCEGQVVLESLETLPKLNAQCDRLALEKHPTLHFFKIRGSVSGSATSTASSSLSISLRLRDGSATALKQLTVFAPESLEDIKLDFSGDLSPKQVNVAALTFESSLGRLVGKGSLSFTPQGNLSSNSEFSGNIGLSESGLAVIGPYLALAANLPVDQRRGSWQIRVQGTGQRTPTLIVKPD